MTRQRVRNENEKNLRASVAIRLYRVKRLAFLLTYINGAADMIFAFQTHCKDNTLAFTYTNLVNCYFSKLLKDCEKFKELITKNKSEELKIKERAEKVKTETLKQLRSTLEKLTAKKIFSFLKLHFSECEIDSELPMERQRHAKAWVNHSISLFQTLDFKKYSYVERKEYFLTNKRL